MTWRAGILHKYQGYERQRQTVELTATDYGTLDDNMQHMILDCILDKRDFSETTDKSWIRPADCSTASTLTS